MVAPINNLIITGANSPSPIFQFSTPNTDSVTYTIKLRVTDANGCLDSTQKDYTVYAQPVAGFNISKRDSCGPLEVNFTNTSTSGLSGAGQGLTYSWHFGNGITSSKADTSVVFQNNGVRDTTYFVELQVQNALGCSDTIMDSVVVTP
ncbi:MAG: PKD domain-containing protein [Owenweeksia sp.]|nr:PKD domain-containing protein [Owenweeksia sp.]